MRQPCLAHPDAPQMAHKDHTPLSFGGLGFPHPHHPFHWLLRTPMTECGVGGMGKKKLHPGLEGGARATRAFFGTNQQGETSDAQEKENSQGRTSALP